MLLGLISLVLLLSLLTWVQVPNSIFAWKLSILAGEFGHWLVLAPLGLAVWAGWTLDGMWLIAAWTLCAAAVAGFVRPLFSAQRIAQQLPDGLAAAFGRRTMESTPFDFGWLFRGAAIPAEQISTEIFSNEGGDELKLDIYRRSNPRDAEKKARPCIIVIHGGGWDGGDRAQLSKWNARWVARGFVVVAVSYRLAPTHIWPAQRDDVRAAVAWVKTQASRYGIDASRLIILGRSAGGQLATAVAYGAHDPAIRGVIALYAPHDLPWAWTVSSEHDALNSVKLFRQYFGGAPDSPERLASYQAASGQLLATKDSPPTLLVHGVPDTLAWVRHSERLSVRLAELGVKHFLLRLPWATHGFDFNPDGPSGQLTDYAIDYFLRQCVSATPPKKPISLVPNDT